MRDRIVSKKETEMRDWISGLPDPVLANILSLLPTKEAVSTCLLSKRWTSLWHQITELKFDGRNFGNLDFFLHFVDATLALVDLDHVEKFVLYSSPHRVPDIKLHIWLQALLFHNSITHLELDFDGIIEPCVTIPSFVFKCPSISVLELNSVNVTNLSAIDYPDLKLKVLDMMDVEFCCSECLELFLSHCPLLERLAVTFTDDMPYINVPLHIGRFQHLNVAEVAASLFPLEALSNVQYLLLKGDAWHPPLNLPTFPNLIHLRINPLALIDWTIVSCLHSFPKLQILQIDRYFGSVSDDEENEEGFVEDAILKVPPCVSFHLEEFAFDDFKGSEREFEFVRFLLENASVLRSVHISKSDYSDGKESHQMVSKLRSCPRMSAKCRLRYYYD